MTANSEATIAGNSGVEPDSDSRHGEVMDTEKIQALLAELHKELGTAEKLPPELAEEARTAVADLTVAMPAEEERHGVVESLEEVATKFESEHPALANAVRQISVALGRMGI